MACAWEGFTIDGDVHPNLIVGLGQPAKAKNSKWPMCRCKIAKRNHVSRAVRA